MTEVCTISQKIGFLFTAITLLCVMLLNNQEITTYRPLTENAASDTPAHLKKTASEKDKAVVKQKVSFEATTSYLVLQLVSLTNWPEFNFTAPLIFLPERPVLPVKVALFFSNLLGFNIVPNAP